MLLLLFFSCRTKEFASDGYFTGDVDKYFNEKALILAFNELKNNFKEKYTLWDRKHSRIEFSLKYKVKL
jgi:hypothetical protein